MSYGVGIDVSKSWLDLHIHGLDRKARFGNTRAGWKQIAAWLAEHPLRSVVLEATGGYEQGALDALHEAGLPMVRVNPRQARDFAKATGQLAKTDALDARVLSHMAATLELIRYQPAAPWQRLLAEYLQRRDHVVLTIHQERQRLSKLNDPWLCRQTKAALKQWQSMLKELNARIAEQIASRPGLPILGQLKGVGPVVLASLAAQLPELGRINNKAVAKLVGVAPLARDSGTMRGVRSIWGGRAVVRNVLYMATLTAIRYEPAIRDFFRQLKERGKPGKVAVVAAMRKLLVILNARMRDALREAESAT
jgi:transposase